MYHLFYGDASGSPGSELTFFEITNIGHTIKGTNSIHFISLLVPNDSSLSYWEQRLTANNVKHQGISQFGRFKALYFEDPDELTLVLLSNEGHEPPLGWNYWENSPVPRE